MKKDLEKKEEQLKLEEKKEELRELRALNASLAQKTGKLVSGYLLWRFHYLCNELQRNYLSYQHLIRILSPIC